MFPEGLSYSMETAFFAPRNHSIMQDFDEFFYLMGVYTPTACNGTNLH